MPFYNVHTHIFTMDNAPEKFLHMYLPDVAANLIDKITNTKAGAKTLSWILSKLPSNASKRYASFLRIGKSSNPYEVFRQMANQYSDPSIKFIILTMFMEECGAGPSKTGFRGQIEEVLEVKKQFPDRVYNFLGVDPRWNTGNQSLKDTVEEYFETKLQVTGNRFVYPFIGLKIYPSNGFYVFDERLKETLQWAAENRVLVLSHCSYLGGLYNNDKNYLTNNLNTKDAYTGIDYDQASYQGKKNIAKWLIGTNRSNNNRNTCSYYLEPESFRTTLDYFKNTGDGLKICLAHYGGTEHILAENNIESIKEDRLFGVNKKNWCGQIQSMMTDFPSLYTDISYSVINHKTHSPVFTDLNNPDYGKRIMFGTDFFMSERAKSEKEIYNTFLRNSSRIKLANGNSAWQQLAENNIEDFLRSKYHP